MDKKLPSSSAVNDSYTTSIQGVILIQPPRVEDDLGCSFESYSEKSFLQATGFTKHFVQDNHSYSKRNVLRGMGYQIPQAQGKLVRVIAGEIFDVAVDLRKTSPTFGQWTGVWLSAANRYQLWIPEGCAHGFLAVSEFAEVIFKTTAYYKPEHERCILWNDPHLAIAWPLKDEPILSKNDQAGVSFQEAEVFC